MLAQQFCRQTQAVVYSTAQAFGFQQFNISGDGKEWVAATAAVASDQLVSVLRDAALRRLANRRLPNQSHAGQGQAWQHSLQDAANAWNEAIAEVHKEYFQEYNFWADQLCLPHPEVQQLAQQQLKEKQKLQHVVPPGLQVAQKLLELSLQFCIYSEAANLRHTPHVLFLIYYIMRGSTTFGKVFQELVTLQHPGQDLPHSHWLFWLKCTDAFHATDNFRSADDFPAAAIAPVQAANDSRSSSGQQPQQYALAGACDLTRLKCSLVQQLYDACPAAFKGPAASGQSLEQIMELEEAKQAILDRLQQGPATATAHGEWVCQQLNLIVSPSWSKAQQNFLRVVVQPLFYFLAEQIDLAGQQAEEEPALRIAYCDVDESACSPAAVYGLIKVLQDRRATDLWQALQEVMSSPSSSSASKQQPKLRRSVVSRLLGHKAKDLPEHIWGRYPRDPNRLRMLNRLAEVMEESDAGTSAAKTSSTGLPAAASVVAAVNAGITAASSEVGQVYALARGGADWWAAHLFKHKTYVEARSVANPFVAFWRVYAFHAAFLTLMVAAVYVYQDQGGKVLSMRMAAAVLLPTVTDALMRVAQAAAHLMLLVYYIPVKRKVGTMWKVLNPFPPGAGWIAFQKLVLMLCWLVWAGVLGISTVPMLLGTPLWFIKLLMTLVQDKLPWMKPAMPYTWMFPAFVHALLVWGAAIVCQRSGYTASLGPDLQAMFGCISRGKRGLQAALAGASFAGAHARCAADSAIDALFFPARFLAMDRRRSWLNAVMWVLVFALKAAFEIFVVIVPLLELMRQVLRERPGFLESAFSIPSMAAWIASTALMLTALAVPVIMLSFSDTGIIFSIVGAAVSSLIGLRKGVGTIKSWNTLVTRFETLMQRYTQHCVSRSGFLLHLYNNDQLAVQEVCMSALSSGWNALVLDLRQRDLLSNRELACLTFEELQLTHEQKHKLRTLPHVEQLGLTTVLPARCFLAGAVTELASGGVGSDHHLWVGGMCWGWLLWICWQTGLLYSRDLTKDMDADQWRSLQMEATRTLQSLTSLRLLHPPKERSQIHRWQELLSQTISLLRLLSRTASCPSNTEAAAAAAVAGEAGTAPRGLGAQGSKAQGLLHGMPLDDKGRQEALRDLSHCMNRLVTLIDEELEEVAGVLGRRSSIASVHDATLTAFFGGRGADITRAECQDARKALDGLRLRWQRFASEAAVEAAPGITQRFSVETDEQQLNLSNRHQLLEDIAELGQASEGPAQVVRWLTDVLTMYEGDTVPADDEAVRFILNFASSLNDPGLGTAPSLQEMPSMTTLVPHYDEDVLYALSESDALSDLSIRDPSQLRADGKAKMVYLLQPDGSSTPTLSYLRSVYSTPGQTHTQWNNFVERIKGLAAAKGLKNVPAQIHEYHFLPGRPLHSLKNELLLWASWRGQLLARTVRGLMTYRTALAALADFENPHLLPTELQQQLDVLLARQHLNRRQQQQLQQRQTHLQKVIQQEQQQITALQQKLQRQQTVQRQVSLRRLQSRPSSPPEHDEDDEEQQQYHQQYQLRIHKLQRQLVQHQDEEQNLQQGLQCLHEGFTATNKQQLEELVQAQQLSSALRCALLEDLVDCKYNLVVSSQNFGVFASPKESSVNMKAAWLVHSIHLLRQQHPAFKVAFIDKQLLVTASRPGHKLELFRQASVLLATERQHKLAKATGVPLGKEAYRVLLPLNFESGRGVVLGEGKPENQNHAVIFCPGEALQTIDCNQDSIVAEGLKLRNLLAGLLPEKDPAEPVSKWGLSLMSGVFGSKKLQEPNNGHRHERRRSGNGQVALIGFKEWIFSEDSGALAEFAAATERSFGTTVQRLMYNPGACRFHYGHPDVWRRSFVSTCGGVSKANKSLHVSEDVFGGYNVMLRGRNITFVDFIAVGKGRDMGFETINTFEAKIAAGNGEQVLSREVRRLAHNMDFARLLTWYHTGNGFFINTAIIMVSVLASLWAYLLLALDKNANPVVQRYLSMMQLVQLGSFSVLVYMFTLALEVGVLKGIITVLRQMLQGSLMFFIFRSQTSAYSFIYDLLFGGAKYLATGRGYKLAPTSFKELYRRFGRSHFYFGAVLLQYCIACIAAGHLGWAGLLVLWAPLLVVISLLFGPFWFTPFAFRTKTVSDDFNEMQKWFASPSNRPESSWQGWNADFWKAAANASGKQLGRLAACLRAHLFKLPTFIMVLAAVARMKLRDGTKLPKYALALILAGGTLMVISIIRLSRKISARSALKYQWVRFFNTGLTLALIAGLIAAGWASSGQKITDITTFSNICLALFVTVLLLRLLPLVHYNSLLGRWATDLADAVNYVADVTLTYFLNGLRLVLSLFDILTGLQAQLLFNTSFASQVMADQSLEHSKLPDLIRQALQRKREMRAQQQLTHH